MNYLVSCRNQAYCMSVTNSPCRRPVAVTDILSPYDMHKRTPVDSTVAPPFAASTSTPAYYHPYGGGCGSGGGGQAMGMSAASYPAPASYHDYISHFAAPPVPPYPPQYGAGPDYGQPTAAGGFVAGTWYSPECHDSKFASEWNLCDTYTVLYVYT